MNFLEEIVSLLQKPIKVFRKTIVDRNNDPIKTYNAEYAFEKSALEWDSSPRIKGTHSLIDEVKAKMLKIDFDLCISITLLDLNSNETFEIDGQNGDFQFEYWND